LAERSQGEGSAVVAKKKTSTASKRKKKTSKPRSSANKPKARDKATEIVFSYAEIDFLRKITKKDFEASTPKERRARLSLRDKLLDINFGAPDAGGGGLIVLELMVPEVDFLQHITKEVYSFITAEERRARLILREKILIAVEKVTGKKIQLEEAP
jgi:hypothetical protein